MITVNQVSKSFGDVKAVDQLSLSVNEGELFGVLGADGAGKTTLFRLIISLLIPNSGSISLWGLNPVVDYKKIRAMTGYMPGRFSLYGDLTVEENLNFFATVFGTTIQENYDLIKDIYSQIEPFKNRKAKDLSGGMKQKLALSCALIHKPKFLVLDEPTTGVDAVSRNEFWDMLGDLKQSGMTILVSTPYMDEAERCDRLALMQHGKILEIGTPRAIIDGFANTLYSIKSNHPYQVIQLMKKMPACLSVYPFGDAVHFIGKQTAVNVMDVEAYLKQNEVLDAKVSIGQPTIEDRFIQLLSPSYHD